MVTMKELVVRLSSEQLEEIEEMVRERIAEIKAQLCEDCPYGRELVYDNQQETNKSKF